MSAKRFIRSHRTLSSQMNDSTCLAGGLLAPIRGKTKARELWRSLASATTSILLDLPGKSHSQLHRAAAAIEKEFIQKLGRGYENVARVHGLGFRVLIARAIVANSFNGRAGQADTRWVNDGAIPRRIAVCVGVYTRERSNRLAGLRQIGAAPLPVVG